MIKITLLVCIVNFITVQFEDLYVYIYISVFFFFLFVMITL